MINAKLGEVLSHLRTATANLESKQNVSLEEYLTNWEARDVVERELEKAVQCCIDLGARLTSLRGWRRASDNHEVFDVLAENGVIEAGLANRVKPLVGLRNVLAHEYRGIRNQEVHRHLTTSTEVLREFASRIAAYCARNA